MLAVQEFWGKEKNFTMEKKQNHFSGQLGFVLAAAGSAVGVGNLWRFPYLAAKDGGGLFLIIYFILVLTFGFTLLTSDIAIGRRTQKSAIGAYEQMRPKWKGLGILTFLVPVLIMTYYAVIGGWITKYAVVYVSGQASAAAADDYFTSFITSPVSPVVFALLFMGVTALIVYNGVQNGIEKVSRWMMPVLLVLVVVIACYSLTLSHTNADGQVVTRLAGLSVLSDAEPRGTDRAALSPDPSGRDESAVLLAERFHGHHDHLRLVCAPGGRPQPRGQPDRDLRYRCCVPRRHDDHSGGLCVLGH